MSPPKAVMTESFDPEDLQKGYDRGEVDHKAGKRLSDNPYDLNKQTLLFMSWEDGWVTSEDIAQGN